MLDLSGKYEVIEGLPIHYVKVGYGAQILLLIPGAMGTAKIDMLAQLEGLDHEQFTMIGFDAPGFGKSHPPERIYSGDVYERDARFAATLMDRLGYKFYSVLGWCYGSRIAMLMAVSYQSRVEKLVLVAPSPFISSHDMKALEKTYEMEKYFRPGFLKICYDLYGREHALVLWKRHVDFMMKSAVNPATNWDIRARLKDVWCPTLVLHGQKDPMIDKSHPLTILHSVPNCRLINFPEGSHMIQKSHAKELNEHVGRFLLGECINNPNEQISTSIRDLMTPLVDPAESTTC